MKFRRIIAALVGVAVSWTVLYWPVKALAKPAKIGIQNQMIMGDDDDDDKLPPPPWWVPTPDSYTPGGNG